MTVAPNNITPIQPYLDSNHENQPHSAREAICLACQHRFMLVHATKTWLKDLHCDCGVKGLIIGTGQEIDFDNLIAPGK